MAKKKNTNNIHTYAKVNKHFIFFALLGWTFNLIATLIAAVGVLQANYTEIKTTTEEAVRNLLKVGTVNLLIIFGVAAVLLQLNHVFARKDSKAIYGVTVVSAGLLIWTIISIILMFNF